MAFQVAEILTVCDAIASAITAAVAAAGDQTTAERLYLGPATLKGLVSRKVFVFPGKYANSPVNRAEDEWNYAVAVVIARLYEPAGEPTKAWLDEEVNFVQQCVIDALDFSRDPLRFGSRELWTRSSEVLVYDDQRLDEEKLFWSQANFEFVENKGI